MSVVQDTGVAAVERQDQHDGLQQVGEDRDSPPEKVGLGYIYRGGESESAVTVKKTAQQRAIWAWPEGKDFMESLNSETQMLNIKISYSYLSNLLDISESDI